MVGKGHVCDEALLAVREYGIGGKHVGPRGGMKIGMILRWSKEKRGLGSGNNRSMSISVSSSCAGQQYH